MASANSAQPLFVTELRTPIKLGHPDGVMTRIEHGSNYRTDFCIPVEYGYGCESVVICNIMLYVYMPIKLKAPRINPPKMLRWAHQTGVVNVERVVLGHIAPNILLGLIKQILSFVVTLFSIFSLFILFFLILTFTYSTPDNSF